MNSNSTDPREIRRFGIICFFFFGSLCALAVWRQKPVPATLFGLLGCLGACFVLLPSPSRPLYTGWLKIAHLVGRIVTTAMLTLAYFLVITPAAWLKRLFGGRPLPTKPDRRVASYWVARDEPAQPRERFLKRF